MKFRLQTGRELDLPTLADVEVAIEEFETELARLRRLRKVVSEMSTTDAVAGKIVPPEAKAQ